MMDGPAISTPTELIEAARQENRLVVPKPSLQGELFCQEAEDSEVEVTGENATFETTLLVEEEGEVKTGILGSDMMCVVVERRLP